MSKFAKRGASAAVRKRLALSLLTLSALSVVGCSSGQPVGRTSPSVGGNVDIPADQRPILADGQVTLAEYQAAFASWERCVDDSGGRIRVDSRDPITGVIQFSVGGRLGTAAQPRDDSPEARCYHQYFDLVEDGYTNSPIVIQEQDRQAMENYLNHDRHCLIANGIDAPLDVDLHSAQFSQLISRSAELGKLGKCPTS